VLSGGVAQFCTVEINQPLKLQQARDIGTPHLAPAFPCGEMIAKRTDLMMVLGWKHSRFRGREGVVTADALEPIFLSALRARSRAHSSRTPSSVSVFACWSAFTAICSVTSPFWAAS
jgi:hypothetical protein